MCFTTGNISCKYSRKYLSDEMLFVVLLPLLCLLSCFAPTARSVSWPRLELVLQPQLGMGSPSGPVGQGASSPGGPGEPRSPFRPRLPFLPGAPSWPGSPCSPRSPFRPGMPSSPARPSCPGSPFSPSCPVSPYNNSESTLSFDLYFVFLYSDGSFVNCPKQSCSVWIPFITKQNFARIGNDKRRKRISLEQTLTWNVPPGHLPDLPSDPSLSCPSSLSALVSH